MSSLNIFEHRVEIPGNLRQIRNYHGHRDGSFLLYHQMLNRLIFLVIWCYIINKSNYIVI